MRGGRSVPSNLEPQSPTVGREDDFKGTARHGEVEAKGTPLVIPTSSPAGLCGLMMSEVRFRSVGLKVSDTRLRVEKSIKKKKMPSKNP